MRKNRFKQLQVFIFMCSLKKLILNRKKSGPNILRSKLKLIKRTLQNLYLYYFSNISKLYLSLKKWCTYKYAIQN
jgi:hypothetical protein